MNKRNQILAAILAIQLVVLVVVFWPSSVASTGPLFAGLSADQVVRLTIRDAEGAQITLARDGAGWVLPDAGDYPVQAASVEALLEKVVDISGDRVVTQTSASHERLKVSDAAFERLITFELADGTSHKLYLGSAPNYQVLHVRADDQDAVYLALGLTVYDARAEATAWVDPVYLSVPTDQVVAWTLDNPNGTFKFEKDEAGTWTMEGLAPGETLNQNSVATAVGRLQSVQMLRPLGKEEKDEYGLQDPSASIVVETQDEEGNENTYILRIGEEQEGDGWVVKSATSPYYVLVTEFTAMDWVEKARGDFLEAPPAPELEATPES